jgi:hypothetical protein
VVDRAGVAEWIEEYERAWRSPGTAALGTLFADGASYTPSPWAEPVRGLEELARFWERERDGAGEGFRMRSEIVGIDGATAVVRVAVDYDDGERWRDLWIVTFDTERRCRTFEEWPFAIDQPDGH